METVSRTIRRSALLRTFHHKFGARCSSTPVSPSSTVPDNLTEKQLASSFNRDVIDGGVVPVFRCALLWHNRTALQDDLGAYTYANLHHAARHLARDISKQLGGETKTTVAYLCDADASHVIVQWAIWMSGNIAVPLSSLHPPAMLEYFISDSGAPLVICSEQHHLLLSPVAKQLKRPLLRVSRGRQIGAQVEQIETSAQPTVDEGQSNKWYGQADAMLIYTSGTTNKPKGVVWTHSAWTAAAASLQAAWHVGHSDVVLHALPLHHVHGQLNSFTTTLTAGGRIVTLGSFSAHGVWSRLLGLNEKEHIRVNVFHGVPAMYAKLIQAHATMFGAERTKEYVRATLQTKVRLMCCGSAPLPETVLQQWEEISGHRLLERYGMTEVGMALSNPYRPERERTPGSVGRPLPGVSARIADDALRPLISVHTAAPDMLISVDHLNPTSEVKDLFSEQKIEDCRWKPSTIERHVESKDDVYQGELLLKGPSVFKRYWNRSPSLAEKDFTADGWFRTGDTASYSNGRFKILGRTSIDIIKTGGYKVSAIEIESTLLNHPSIADVGVVGVPDDTWGERVCAAVVLKPGARDLSAADLKEWGKSKMAAYQVPTTFSIIDAMPRNIMGKLDKKEIVKLFRK